MDNFGLYLYCLIAFVLFPGIILNLSLFIVLFKMKNQLKSYFALVKSLILADLVLSITFAFCTINSLFEGGGRSEYLRYFCFYFTEYLLYVVLLNLIALASEHYVAIIKPLHYKNWVRCRYIFCRLSTIWIIPSLLVFFGYLLPQRKDIEIEKRNNDDTVITTYIYKNDWSKTFRVPFVLTCFMIMTIIYIYIYFIVRKQQIIHQLQNQHVRTNKKALVTTTFNLLSFFLCWFPTQVAELWFQISNPTDMDNYHTLEFWMNSAIPLLIGMNSICDPLIYAVRFPAVRKVWKRKFCCCL